MSFKFIRVLSLCITLACNATLYAQQQLPAANTEGSDSSGFSYPDISDRALNFIQNKYTNLSNSVESKSVKLLKKVQKKEERLQAKVTNIDSSKAKELFTGTQLKLRQLETKIKSPVTNISNQTAGYSSALDSVQTSLQFLLSSKSPIPIEKLNKIQDIIKNAKLLQSRLQQANEIQAYIKERETQLKTQLSQYGLGKQLLGINKEAYYYQQQINDYRELVNDPEKLGKIILSKVRSIPAFQSFWQHNSFLAQLFPAPENYGTTAALAGLQTRAQVSAIINQRLPGSFAQGNNGSSYLQQQLQTAEAQMNELKDKVNKLGGGSSDITMPDFKPNSQKTKSFLKRLEYGFNFQTSQPTKQLPTISDIGLTLGYRLSDKAVIGIGASYKFGLGRGFDHIAFTSEGLSTRSYMDIKAKGSIWITGGYEYNYLQRFLKLSDLQGNINSWQKSALVGITKKYKIGKNKQGNMQLLYDLLYKTETPRGTALKFRIGYSF